MLNDDKKKNTPTIVLIIVMIFLAICVVGAALGKNGSADTPGGVSCHNYDFGGDSAEICTDGQSNYVDPDVAHEQGIYP